MLPTGARARERPRHGVPAVAGRPGNGPRPVVTGEWELGVAPRPRRPRARCPSVPVRVDAAPVCRGSPLSRWAVAARRVGPPGVDGDSAGVLGRLTEPGGSVGVLRREGLLRRLED